MFCYQCQEAAKGTGCTMKGICGEDEKVANLQDVLLYTLKGIAIFVAFVLYNGFRVFRPSPRYVSGD